MSATSTQAVTTHVVPDAVEISIEYIDTARDLPFEVLLWNDPVTLMDVVVRVLRKVFGYTADKAELLMLTAHREGKAVVWTGERDRAVRYCIELGSNGLQSTIRRGS
jgi:ATP-dependent Clp protease adaptor protein ClpS